jgi:hypothetical protein
MNSRAVDHIRRRPAGVSARQTASAVGRGPNRAISTSSKPTVQLRQLEMSPVNPSRD